jgi:hypothetical protein
MVDDTAKRAGHHQSVEKGQSKFTAMESNNSLQIGTASGTLLSMPNIVSEDILKRLS